MHAYILSKENPALARAEVHALVGKGKLIGNTLIAGSCDFRRLGFTHYVLDILSYSENLEALIKKVNWKDRINGSFFLDSRTGTKAAVIANKIWKSLENPVADSKNPKHKLVLVKSDNTYFLGELIFENTKDYMQRLAHKRPYMHPSSMHPKLSRACVNLLGQNTRRILDPFCGTGGILIEAGLMGLEIMGSDIDPEMIRKCSLNLSHYGLKAELSVRDGTLPHDEKYIVTDLPYGRNTYLEEGLYGKFLESISNVKKAVVMFPNKVPRKLMKKLIIEQDFSVYIHKSLTKRIVVVKGRII
jgi:tRNA (guanine10-N2)-dimethyltransferase